MLRTKATPTDASTPMQTLDFCAEHGIAWDVPDGPCESPPTRSLVPDPQPAETPDSSAARPSARSAEQPQEQQEDVEHVEKDAGGERDRLVAAGAPQAVEVDDGVEPEDREPERASTTVYAAGMRTKISTMPATIRASSSQNAIR